MVTFYRPCPVHQHILSSFVSVGQTTLLQLALSSGKKCQEVLSRLEVWHSVVIHDLNTQLRNIKALFSLYYRYANYCVVWCLIPVPCCSVGGWLRPVEEDPQAVRFSHSYEESWTHLWLMLP